MIKRALLQMHEEALDYVMENINPEHLTLHMCDINSNKELLSKSVFYEASPTLAAVAYFDVPTDKGNACVRVNEHLLSQLGMTKNEVLACCIANLEKTDFVVKNLNEVIKEMMGNDIFSMDEEEIPLYVATNKSKIQGSNILASKKALHNSIYNSVGEDCYILPSSTHEVLFVPKSSGFDIAILKDMVETVNRTEVNSKDKLSDNVFEYNLSTRTLSLANTEDRENTKAKGKKICM